MAKVGRVVTQKADQRAVGRRRQYQRHRRQYDYDRLGPPEEGLRPGSPLRPRKRAILASPTRIQMAVLMPVVAGVIPVAVFHPGLLAVVLAVLVAVMVLAAGGAQQTVAWAIKGTVPAKTVLPGDYAEARLEGLFKAADNVKPSYEDRSHVAYEPEGVDPRVVSLPKDQRDRLLDQMIADKRDAASKEDKVRRMREAFLGYNAAPNQVMILGDGPKMTPAPNYDVTFHSSPDYATGKTVQVTDGVEYTTWKVRR